MQYEDIRYQLKMGDLVGVSGKGFVSSVIQMATSSDISHVGVVLDSVCGGQKFIQIMESTSLGNGFAGVKTTRLSDMVKNCEGRVYIYPLKDELWRSMDHYQFAYFLLTMKGRPYDAKQAIMSAIDGPIPDSKEDFSKLFCSELAYEAYERGNVIPPGNASEQDPNDVVNLDIFDERILIDKPVL